MNTKEIIDAFTFVANEKGINKTNVIKTNRFIFRGKMKRICMVNNVTFCRNLVLKAPLSFTYC